MKTLREKCTVEANSGELRLRLEADLRHLWGDRDRYDMTGTVGGAKWRGPARRDDDGWFITLGPAWVRDNAGSHAGSLEIRLDLEGPQAWTMGEDVETALRARPEALRFFEGLPSFYRNNFARWIAEAKKPETRARRVQQLVELLAEGKRER